MYIYIYLNISVSHIFTSSFGVSQYIQNFKLMVFFNWEFDFFFVTLFVFCRNEFTSINVLPLVCIQVI